jgi:hypothetical protein
VQEVLVLVHHADLVVRLHARSLTLNLPRDDVQHTADPFLYLRGQLLRFQTQPLSQLRLYYLQTPRFVPQLLPRLPPDIHELLQSYIVPRARRQIDSFRLQRCAPTYQYQNQVAEIVVGNDIHLVAFDPVDGLDIAHAHLVDQVGQVVEVDRVPLIAA